MQKGTQMEKGSKGIFPFYKIRGEALTLYLKIFDGHQNMPSGPRRTGREETRFYADVEFADGQKHALKRKIRRLITFYIMAHSSSSVGKVGYGR